MSKKLRELQARKAKLIQEKVKALQDMRAITNKADAEKRDMTEEEVTTFDGIKAKTDELDKLIESVDKTIACEEALSASEQSLSATEMRDGTHIVVRERVLDDPKRGFRFAGEF